MIWTFSSVPTFQALVKTLSGFPVGDAGDDVKEQQMSGHDASELAPIEFFPRDFLPFPLKPLPQICAGCTVHPAIRGCVGCGLLFCHNCIAQCVLLVTAGTIFLIVWLPTHQP